MKKPGKPVETVSVIPRAQTIRRGSYRLVEDPSGAVTVKIPSLDGGAAGELNQTDWFLYLMDSGWEKAEEAYYRGLEEGFQMGLSAGRSDVVNFRRTLESLDMSLLEFYSGVERWSVKLALKIAEKVVGQAAREQEDLVRQTVRRAIQETADKTRILIKVNPGDLEVLKGVRDEIGDLFEGIEHFKIETDMSIAPGSCRVTSPSGLLDADFTTQLQELRRALIFQSESGDGPTPEAVSS